MKIKIAAYALGLTAALLVGAAKDASALTTIMNSVGAAAFRNTLIPAGNLVAAGIYANNPNPQASILPPNMGPTLYGIAETGVSETKTLVLLNALRGCGNISADRKLVLNPLGYDSLTQSARILGGAKTVLEGAANFWLVFYTKRTVTITDANGNVSTVTYNIPFEGGVMPLHTNGNGAYEVSGPGGFLAPGTTIIPSTFTC